MTVPCGAAEHGHPPKVIVTGASPTALILPTVVLALVLLGQPRTAHAQVVDTLRVDSLAVDTLAADSLTGPDTLSADSIAGEPLAGMLPLDSTYVGPLPPRAATQIGYLTSAYPDTPGGMGLIETGMLEAEIATQHVDLAGRDSTDLPNMTRHMTHVLHAIDPSEVGQGPGMGYGFKPAAEAVMMHAEQVATVDDVPGVLDFHAPYLVRSARGAVARADEAIAVARQVQRSTSAEAAHRLVERLAGLVRAMAHGDDRDGDGRIGYTESESGLAQVTYHLRMVERLTSVDGPLPR